MFRTQGRLLYCHPPDGVSEEDFKSAAPSVKPQRLNKAAQQHAVSAIGTSNMDRDFFQKVLMSSSHWHIVLLYILLVVRILCVIGCRSRSEWGQRAFTGWRTSLVFRASPIMSVVLPNSTPSLGRNTRVVRRRRNCADSTDIWTPTREPITTLHVSMMEERVVRIFTRKQIQCDFNWRIPVPPLRYVGLVC